MPCTATISTGYVIEVEGMSVEVGRAKGLRRKSPVFRVLSCEGFEVVFGCNASRGTCSGVWMPSWGSSRGPCVISVRGMDITASFENEPSCRGATLVRLSPCWAAEGWFFVFRHFVRRIMEIPGFY